MTMKEKYVEECAVIQQNCTYTAETHHIMAVCAKDKAFWLEVIPAVCAALSSALIATGILDVKLLPFTVLSATFSAVAAVVHPKEEYQEHLAAAQSFTALKHDARFLREAQSVSMSDDAFAIAVQNLHERYNELLKATPPTDEESFAKAQAVIQKGTHEPDLDDQGKIL